MSDYNLQTSKLTSFFLAFLFLHSISYMSYTGVNPTLYGQLSKIILFILLLVYILNMNTIRSEVTLFKSFRYVVLFLILPLLCSISCYLEYGQSILTSINVSFGKFFLLVYFFLIYKKVNTDTIIRIIVFFAFIRTGLTLIEQLTYPNVLFASRMDGYNSEGVWRELEVRSGFYRFLIADAFYLPLFAAFVYFNKLMEKFSYTHLLIFLFFCFGLYMDQSRQILVSFAICLLFSPFLSGQKKLNYIFIIAIFAFLLFIFANVLFSDLVDSTREDVNEDNIRLFSYAYYWDNRGGFITQLFGNGFTGGTGTYANIITDAESAGLWRVDIGIIGALHKLGWVFILTFVLYYYRVIFKNWKSIDRSVLMMMISIIANLPMIFPLYNFSYAGYECFMAFMFYLIDTSITRASAEVEIKRI